ncbi:protein phosphatase 2C domain-containing protein [Thermonema rossianum]|uniref:protein phosphatase 2C domain-containing protein n=1 Tax=Thermonema rossianum TaxID=55505 RepID=UPI000570F172|nr:protein phosphatase 2C domain-containing protein [Thermonema rossianum]
MKIYKFIQKGSEHPNYCEDFLLDLPLGRSFYFGAVIDGCSSGYDSQFSAALYGKLLRKVVKTIPFGQAEHRQTEQYVREVMTQFVKELKSIQKRLQLEINELLATFVLMFYSEELHEAFLLVSGNGVLCIDGEITEIEAQSEMDYLAYHLSRFSFDKWYDRHTYRFKIDKPQDITISTNGIETISSPQLGFESDAFDIIHYLFIDNTYDYMPTMLQRKFAQLADEYHCVPTDDITIIRAKF